MIGVVIKWFLIRIFLLKDRKGFRRCFFHAVIFLFPIE
ncbi:Uncharacterised protein [Vibrio cholerae]|nr:Uncharacterised protein [Vibrio cholerae]